MDFFSLVDTHRQLLRHLNGDDDFGRLENENTREQPAVTLTSEESYEQLIEEGQEKLLSPSAEAELFLLATNFLLCKCKFWLLNPLES